jgi:hypothetical protein
VRMIKNEWHWSVSEYEPEENQEEKRRLGTRSLLRAHAHVSLSLSAHPSAFAHLA